MVIHVGTSPARTNWHRTVSPGPCFGLSGNGPAIVDVVVVVRVTMTRILWRNPDPIEDDRRNGGAAFHGRYSFNRNHHLLAVRVCLRAGFNGTKVGADYDDSGDWALGVSDLQVFSLGASLATLAETEDKRPGGSVMNVDKDPHPQRKSERERRPIITINTFAKVLSSLPLWNRSRSCSSSFMVTTACFFDFSIASLCTGRNRQADNLFVTTSY